jgi:transglutaminase-like putative cysteine protease
MFRNLNFQRITASILIAATFNTIAVPVVQAHSQTPLAAALSAMGIGGEAGGTGAPRAEPRLQTNEEHAARMLAQLHDHLKAVVPDTALPRDALRLQTSAGSGGVITNRGSRIKQIRERAAELRSSLGSVEKGFADDAIRFPVSTMSGELAQRHRSAVTQYRERKADFEQLVNKLDAAATGSANEQTALSELGTFMGKYAASRVHRYTDPNRLPFRAPDAAPREPFTTADEFQASLFSEPAEQRASIEMDGNALAAAALPALPVAADTAPTEDVRITQPIRELASRLGNNPVRIFNWVRNEIGFVPTYGSIQGSELTFLNKRGNAFDTASLLIALYRAAGIPARYVYGTIDVPVEQAMNWFGATTPAMAHTIVTQGGVPNLALVSGGAIKVLRMEHVWVEAYVDFTPSRGAVNRTPDMWVPLDASFKQFDVAERPDIEEVLDFDHQKLSQAFLRSATVDAGGERIAGGDQQALLAEVETLRRNGTSWAATVGLAQAVDRLGNLRRVRTVTPAFLAGSLPYRVVAKAQTFQQVPSNLRWKLVVRYFASDTEMAYDNSMFEHTLPLPAIGTRRLSLSFAPASDVDAELLRKAKEQGASSLPAYMIRGIPRLSLDGDMLKSGAAAQFGGRQVATLTMIGPQHSSAPDRYEVTAGDELVISVDAAGLSQAMIDERFSSVVSDTASENLHTAGMVFWLLSDMGDTFAAAAHGVTQMRLPSVAVLSSPLRPAFFFGIPRTASYVGRNIDAKRVLSAAANSDGKIPAAFMRQSGLQVSNYEGLAFDMTFQREPGSGGSAIRLINSALADGAPIYRIGSNNATLLDGLPHSSDVLADLRNAVAAGKEVIVPGAASGTGNWRGLGYIVIDPETGAGAYLIDGGFNGGTDDVGCEGAPATAPAAQPVSKPSVSLFAALAMVMIAIAVAALLINAGIVAALAGTLIAASTAATAAPAPNPGDPLPPGVQQAWERGFGRVYGNFPLGPTYPGSDVLKCSPEQHASLESEKSALCGKPMRCTGEDCNAIVIQEKIAARNACIDKRLEIMFICFSGGDAEHWRHVQQLLQGQARCESCLNRVLAGQCSK